MRSSRIPASYFENYCGRGRYDDHYLFHSGIEHCIEIADHFELRIDSVIVLGAATGRVLDHFERAWGVRPEGCELSAWAHRRIAARHRSRIRCADMRRYVPRLLREGRQVDLIFSNSLVYLPAADLPRFLAQCAQLGRYLHFLSSTSEDFEPGDSFRVLLRPRRWWRAQFMRAGFAPTRSRYLFRSLVLTGDR
jgi:hypothetical protein